jgi:succinate-semialdehyde dehydrogenase/glutarate-semialdehyde dehydrogenase
MKELMHPIKTLNDLVDPSLVKMGLFIGGRWLTGDKKFPNINPATEQVLCEVYAANSDDTRRAIASADKAWPSYRQSLPDQRYQYLSKWAALIQDNLEDLALLLTLEQGKPLAEARGEVAFAQRYAIWYAEQAKRIEGHTVAPHANDLELLVEKIPVGVGAAITPWNFPVSMITRKLAPALAAGCPVVLKPSEDTPLTAAALIELLHRAGLPDGVVNLLPTSRDQAATLGEVFTSSSCIKKISFTGSANVGKQLSSQAAKQLQRVSMELGGNAPSIIFEDANLETAVEHVCATKFRNAGQVCIATNRILVQRSVLPAFTKLLQSRIATLVPGNGLIPGVTLGPIINQRALERIHNLVMKAKAQGANILCGGYRLKLTGYFYAPTLLTDVSPDNCIFKEEIFGPIAAITVFDTELEAITLANDSPSGLAAYFYSENANRCRRVSQGLEAGMIGQNCSAMTNERMPFGGLKHSGIGREGGVEGIEAWLETRFHCRAYTDQT